jgi:hypothetical protein
MLDLRKAVLRTVAESAATAGGDEGTAGATCTMLLAVAGGRTPESAAVRSGAAEHSDAAGTHGIVEAVAAEKSVQEEEPRERCRRNRFEQKQFRC